MSELNEGGWIKPGLAIVTTGRPEPILNPKQWEQWRRDE